MHVSPGPALTGMLFGVASAGWFASVDTASRIRGKQRAHQVVWLFAASLPAAVVLWWLHLFALTQIEPGTTLGWSVPGTSLSLLVSVASTSLCLAPGRRVRDASGAARVLAGGLGLCSVYFVDLAGSSGVARAGLDVERLVPCVVLGVATATVATLAAGATRRTSTRLALIPPLGAATAAMLAMSIGSTALVPATTAAGVSLSATWLAVGGGFCATAAVATGLLVSFFDRRLERLTERSVGMVRQNEKRLERILQQLPFGIVVADAGTQAVVFSNREADRVLRGLDRRADQKPFFPTNGAMGDPLSRALRDEETIDRELQVFPRGDGRNVSLEISAAPIYDERDRMTLAIAAFQDVSTRVGAEADLRQAQKMDALGQLTGGIAHDTNNLLTAILGNLDLLEPRLTDDGQRMLLRNALSATERGAKLTSQLLGFSRRQALTPCPVDVNRAVSDMHPLLVSTLGGTIRIVCGLEAELWPAYADPTQLELVLLNLSINARDAMPSGGAITIGTTNLVLTQSDGPTDPPPGEYVVLSVRDEGTGMSPATLARAFEPFFTTKGPGRGSGLGLSQVLGIAQQLGGGVRITSELGRGTQVDLFMPRSAVAVHAQPLPVATPDRSKLLDGKTVLLVDDDDDVRAAARALLAQFGCIVIEESDGRSAVARVAGAERIDIVLIDFAMPGMTGADAGERMCAIRPNLPILVITGYADADHLPGIEGRFPTLQKPFRGTQLAELLPGLLPQTASDPAAIVPFLRTRRPERDDAPIEPFQGRDVAPISGSRTV